MDFATAATVRGFVFSWAILGLASHTYAAPTLQAAKHSLVARGIVSPSNAELLHNTIGFGVPSVILYSMRMLNRMWVLRSVHLEDYIMSATMCFYIVLLALINLSARYATNLYPPEQEASILADPVDVQSRIYGSIIVIPLEQCMLASTWGVKICIWLFLKRLCRQLPSYQMALTVLLGYIISGYVIIQLFYYVGVCRPFSQYWAVPVQNLQCATYQHYSIVQMIFNVTSDLALMFIPIKMIMIARLPPMRRLVITAPFTLAFFTILAAVLNKAYNFASPMTTTYQLWYIRESSVAIWVGNLICCWQLFQKLFKLRSFDGQNANIVDQPAIALEQHRVLRPQQYSNGGTWYPRGFFGRHKLFSRGSTFTTENSMFTRETVSEEMNALNRAPNNKSLGLDTIMSLRRGDDDATAAIAFRAQQNIV